MSYIFISYSHEDKDYAQRLVKELKRLGFEVWLDDRIDYGTKWTEVIEEKLNGCKAIILIMTPNSKKSEWVQNELNWAKLEKKRVFPLLRDGDRPWFSVATLQYVDVRDGNLPVTDFYDTLARVVPRKKVTTPNTTTKSPGIQTRSLMEQKIDEIVSGLTNLKKNTFLGNPLLVGFGVTALKVGKCTVTYSNPFYRIDSKRDGNFTAQVAVINFLALHLDNPPPTSADLSSKLMELGWYWFPENSDFDDIDTFMEKSPTHTWKKEWRENYELVDIANILIDTNGLFSIETREIDVTLQKSDIPKPLIPK